MQLQRSCRGRGRRYVREKGRGGELVEVMGMTL